MAGRHKGNILQLSCIKFLLLLLCRDHELTPAEKGILLHAQVYWNHLQSIKLYVSCWDIFPCRKIVTSKFVRMKQNKRDYRALPLCMEKKCK